MSIAKYSLNVYDDDFEIVKTLEAPGLKWKKLVDIYEKATNPKDFEGDEMKLLEYVMMAIFPQATAEDLENALFEDMAAILNQIMAMGRAFGAGSTSKN